MKHLILFSAFIFLLASSCTKVQRMSRRIDGDWKAVKLFGEDPSAQGEEWIFRFEKDKKGKGTGTITVTTEFGTETYKTRYTMKRTDRMYLTVGDEPGSQTNIAWDFEEFTKEKARMKDVYNDETILEKR